jgi:hypothetical protein
MQRLFGPVEVEQTGSWAGIEVGRVLQRIVALNQAVASRTVCCFVLSTRDDPMGSVLVEKQANEKIRPWLVSYFELHLYVKSIKSKYR